APKPRADRVEASDPTQCRTTATRPLLGAALPLRSPGLETCSLQTDSCTPQTLWEWVRRVDWRRSGARQAYRGAGPPTWNRTRPPVPVPAIHLPTLRPLP